MRETETALLLNNILNIPTSEETESQELNN
jgi:hypothetical protein